MRIIILQLARLGDILQTLPAIQGLKKKHPDCHITYVARQTFSDAARLSPHIDKLVELPAKDILSPYLDDPTDLNKLQALITLEKWIQGELLAEKECDLLVNFTFSEASSFLAKLIPAKEKRGLAGDSIADPWSQYFFSSVLGSSYNIIHLNDLFARIAGVNAGVWPLELSDLRQSPADLIAQDTARRRIGVQLSASRPEKSLTIAAWQEVCSAILTADPGAELLFFGSEKDVAAIKMVTDRLPRESVRVIAGTNRFHENADWLATCDWVVTPDTALVHFASIIAARVSKPHIVEIALGQVRPEETGPYGEGHHVLSPISGTAVDLAAQIAHLIGGGDVVGRSALHSKASFASCVNGSRRAVLNPINFEFDETVNFFIQSYYLLAEFRCSGLQEDIPIPPLGRLNRSQGLDHLLQAYDAMCMLRRLAEFGSHYCMKLIENIDDRMLVGDLMNKLSEVDALICDVEKTVHILRPLVNTWRVSKDLSAAPPSTAAGSTIDIIALAEGSYRELGQNIEIIQQLLQAAVDAAQANEPLNQLAQRRDHDENHPD